MAIVTPYRLGLSLELFDTLDGNSLSEMVPCLINHLLFPLMAESYLYIYNLHIRDKLYKQVMPHTHLADENWISN